VCHGNECTAGNADRPGDPVDVMGQNVSRLMPRNSQVTSLRFGMVTGDQGLAGRLAANGTASRNTSEYSTPGGEMTAISWGFHRAKGQGRAQILLSTRQNTLCPSSGSLNGAQLSNGCAVLCGKQGSVNKMLGLTLRARELRDECFRYYFTSGKRRVIDLASTSARTG
jgi:hypothetical protein